MELSFLDLIKNLLQSKEPVPSELRDDLPMYTLRRGLTNYYDLVFIADSFNIAAPNSALYSAMFNSIPKQARFQKWTKKDNSEVYDKRISLICQYFNCSKREAGFKYPFFNNDDYKEMEFEVRKGGVIK